ncbi:hypothetical protein [Clostridium tertium]|uniref:hypothetical protein n=1 Tax=Clostridium tertium TaxID=1559 RepID=UPI0023B30228|nr:hypothetical protein [Clostridium tertium]
MESKLKIKDYLPLLPRLVVAVLLFIAIVFFFIKLMTILYDIKEKRIELINITGDLNKESIEYVNGYLESKKDASALEITEDLYRHSKDSDYGNIEYPFNEDRKGVTLVKGHHADKDDDSAIYIFTEKPDTSSLSRQSIYIYLEPIQGESPLVTVDYK